MKRFSFPISWFTLFIVLLFIILGCDKPNTYIAKIMNGETISVGSPVYLDGQPIAEVINVDTHKGETFAKFKLTNDKYAELLLVGTIRTPKKDKIYLSTKSVKPDASPLLNNSIINIQNQIEFISQKWATKWNVIAILFVLFFIVALTFILKNIIRFFILACCLVLALFTAYFLHPTGIPYVEKLYQYLPRSESNETTIQTTESETLTEKLENEFEKRLKTIVRGAPNPKYISFALITIVSFLIYSILFNAAMPRKPS